MSCDDHTAQNDSASVEATFGSAIKDNAVVKGYVTIIKNEGKKDEQIVCKNKPNLLTDDGRDYAIAQFYTNTTICLLCNSDCIIVGVKRRRPVGSSSDTEENNTILQFRPSVRPPVR